MTAIRPTIQSTDPTTINGGPDPAIAKTANGSFTQGQSGAGYTLMVRNAVQSRPAAPLQVTR